MVCENHAFPFNFTGCMLVTGFQQMLPPRASPQARLGAMTIIESTSMSAEPGPDGWLGSDSDRRPTSAQFLEAFEDENFACVSLPRGLVILQVFAVTARAFEPN